MKRSHLFRTQGDLEKAELFSRRRKDYLTLYELNGVRDYFHGFMVPRTSYLDLFALHHYSNGFIFQFPRRQWPDMLQPFEDEPRLARVFRDYQDWLSIMGVAGVTSLNEEIRSGRTGDVVLVAEAFHQRQLDLDCRGNRFQAAAGKICADLRTDLGRQDDIQQAPGHAAARQRHLPRHHRHGQLLRQP